MTFEEFFNKKRIDLALMKDADPALYSEFKSHFESMGEKSFDHTKKFWFNKLRHLYHLAEPVKKVVTQVETQIASQAEQLSSPTMVQEIPAAQPEAGQESKAPASAKPGFRPRSIPAAAVKKQEQAAQTEPEVPADKPAAPVSKPGFKPRNIKPLSDGTSEDAQESTVNVSRPAYKPRFNAGKLSENTGNVANKKEEDTDSRPPASQAAGSAEISTSASGAKPAYKPRFNIKVTDESIPPAIKPGIKTAKSPTENSSSEQEESNQSEGVKAAAPKPAYKPRFNVKTIATNTSEEPSASTPEQTADSDALPAENANAATGSQGEPVKPAYKPRFNMKNVKPKE